MSTVSTTDYHVAYQKFIDLSDNPGIRGCAKLAASRRTQVELRQLRSTYWMRPCLKNWPCVGEQHHSNIDDLLERIEAVQLSLLGECEAERHVMIKRGEIPSEIHGGKATATSVNINQAKASINETTHWHAPPLNHT